MAIIYHILYISFLILLISILSFVLLKLHYRDSYRTKLIKFYKKTVKEWNENCNNCKARFDDFDCYLSAQAYDKFHLEHFIEKNLK